MLVQSNLTPLHQLFTGGAQGYVGGTDDAGVVSERSDLNGRLARGGKRVALEVLADLVEVDIGRGRRTAANQEHLGVDHVGNKRQGTAEIVSHGIGSASLSPSRQAWNTSLESEGPVSSMGSTPAFLHSAR